MDTTKFAKMFMMMGDLTPNERTLEEKVAYEQRIVFATMKNQIPNWEQPQDWSDLTLEQKDERLTKIKEML